MSTVPNDTRLPDGTLSVLEIGMGWFPEQPGGLNRVYHDLVRNLPSAHVACTGIITGSDLASRETDGKIRAVVATAAPIRERWRKIKNAVADALASRTIDVVAAHFAIYAWPALSVIRKPLVFHFHGPWALEGAREGAGPITTRIKTLLERRVYRRATRLIVLSEAFKKVLCDTYGVDPDRVSVVPGGVDCNRYDIAATRHRTREQLGWPTDRPIVLAVRRLVHRMGLEDLIAATAALVAKHPKLLVYIAGKGPLSGALAKMIADKGLTDHVKLLGYVSDDDLPLAYRAADLSVVPTVALEGFGLIAIESLAAGTPVIVTPVGGLPEVVAGLSADLICESAGADALQKALDNALDHPESLPSEEVCKSYARKNFDTSVMAARTRAVYQQAMKR